MIRFYTRGLSASELAQFVVEISAPWGNRHLIRGSIIQSTKPGAENTPAVVWPHMGTRLAVYAESPEDSRVAANWILDRWREWCRRCPVEMR